MLKVATKTNNDARKYRTIKYWLRKAAYKFERLTSARDPGEK